MAAQYRALMLREESRGELEKAMDMFETIKGFRPTYSYFITILAHHYIFTSAGDAHGKPGT
jgi:hypothetical protein